MIRKTRPMRILLLEDSDFDAELVIRELRKGGLDFVWHRVQTQKGFELALDDYQPDLILADYKLPDYDGGRAIAFAKQHSPTVPAIIITGAVGEDTAVELFKRGATDFVLKDRMSGRLVGVVERAIMEAENSVIRRQVEEQQAQLNAELRRLASHDPLTGAASRPLLMEKLQEAIGEVDPKAPDTVFFSINLDHFKGVNLTYGSEIGDTILVETSRRLSALCGGRDLVGNLGGDNFYLLIRRPFLEKEMPSLLDAIRECFIQPFQIRNFKIAVDASIGGAILKTPEATLTDILSLCEEAMRQVKSRKHHGIFLADDVLVQEMKSRGLLDKEIQKAVDNKGLFLLFQPIVNLETGRIQGAEALLRYRRGDGLILSAAEFMGSIVRTASLVKVDELVISDFLASNRGLIDPLIRMGDFRLSFNISPGILGNVRYGREILSQMKKAGVPPSSFTLEILEEGLMPTNGAVLENLNVLQTAGVQIAVDDFGIGYSNMLRLSRLPVHELKIPRELTGGIKSGDTRMKAVLDTVVGIAKNLGMMLVAEGVEDQEEADYFRSLGCQYAQGYLFGKAMTLEELLLLVEKGEAAKIPGG
jgi:diguanylate cyclase (GGDEF)-like protein